jgi:hypothetical protein
VFVGVEVYTDLGHRQLSVFIPCTLYSDMGTQAWWLVFIRAVQINIGTLSFVCLRYVIPQIYTLLWSKHEHDIVQISQVFLPAAEFVNHILSFKLEGWAWG